MLVELSVKNLAIIDSLRIGFAPGLNVLTGETGAGKSILVGALDLLLGARTGPDVIRSGEEEASVEALFDVSVRAADLKRVLEAAGFEGGPEIVLRRTVSRSGRGRAYVNGSLVTLAALGSIAGEILSLYGQHEHQGLLRPERPIEILDSIAGLGDALEEYGKLFDEWRAKDERLGRLRASDEDRERRLDFLRFQKNEIDKARLKEGEEEDLLRERKIQRNAQALQAAASEANELLYDGEGSAAEKIRAAQKRVDEIVAVDRALAPGAEALESALICVEEVARSIASTLSRLTYEPERLDEIEARLDEITKLKRKYGASVAEILAAGVRIGRELADLEGRDETIADLTAEVAELHASLEALAGKLTVARRREAGGLAERMGTELASLGMKRTVFIAEVDEAAPDGALGPRGADQVRFLISPNLGEEPRPLDRIASGGELSRILLALTRLLDTRSRPMTVLFDEVDAGIGGAVAEVVGRKLKGVSKDHQVLCITHLPQIASYADFHLSVRKEVVQKRTVTRVEALDAEKRVAEVARMLGGIELTPTTLRHAREMISAARGKAVA